jgi:hypothetical protein
MLGPRPDAETAERHEPPADRRTAAEQTAGAMTGVYGPDHLATLREDWSA